VFRKIYFGKRYGKERVKIRKRGGKEEV